MFSHHPDRLKDDLRAKIMRNLAGEIAMGRFCTDLNKNITGTNEIDDLILEKY
ncbi:hypothetical protein A3Q56_02584 [Intoshia linei]|uniref:Uncharacterized protein n=1 Tax=Intoshia linei TaxID=1819745 RepID=A0A177B7Y1_9BILA|nr:hypothetical protein A3Q56_02584 [Intoshia linei]